MAIEQNDMVTLVPQLRAFARSLTGGDVHLADDLVQDTVVLALRARDQFTPGTNLKAWLLRILHNRFRSVVRRKHVTAEVSDDELLQRCSVPATQENALEVTAFKAAFGALSPVHREVLVLVGVHGLAYEQVAAICGCEIGTIKSRVNRARAMLRSRLMGDDDRRPAPAAEGPARRCRDGATGAQPACR
jgi:RNA polymerase sigma-70 factor (ECF subfamily)